MPDLTNAGLYLTEGDLENAAWSGVGALPGGGDAAKAAKMGVDAAGAATQRAAREAAEREAKERAAREAGEQALTDAQRQALDYATSPNKLDHIFVPKHKLDPLVSQYGSREAVAEQLIRNLGDLPAAGPFQVQRTVGGQEVVIRGAVVEGVPKLGTAYTP